MRTTHSGNLLLEGRRSDFEIASELRPVAMKLDPREEILARFYYAGDHPKRVSRYRALAFLEEGNSSSAEATFLTALDKPVGINGNQAPLPWMYNPESELLRENARIRLVLSRMYIDQGRNAEALAQLETVDESLGPDRATYRMARDTLHSRLDILQGDYLVAYRRLKKTMRLAAPRRTIKTWRASLWKTQLNSERLAMAEAYALLAVAAFETGNLDEFRWALQEAGERGVDVLQLQAAARRDEVAAAREPSIMAR